VEVLDMGCGKGYLTFALHNHLCEKVDAQRVRSVGVEVRPKLVDDINNIARDLGGNFETLSFAVGEIGNYDNTEKEDEKVSALIALHACDTATDDAIYQGIKNDCDVIVLSPCCHKEVRRYMEKNDVKRDAEHPYKNLLRFGVYRERVAEQVTDTLRGMLLEVAGYDVDIFEFIGGEHTAKNCMITATKARKGKVGGGSLEELRDLARMHGIERIKLADLLGVDLGVGEGRTKSEIPRGRMPPK
jgi:SAM-dependent methyltransferase